MALDRTKFNALIDGTTVWNKTQIKDVILDPVDVELAKVVPGVWTTFAPPVFTAAAGTVTVGTVTNLKYLLDGKTLCIQFYIAVSLSVSTSFIMLQLPGTLVSAAWDQVCGSWSMNSGFGGCIDVLPAATVMHLMRDVAQTNPLPSGPTTLVGTATIALS